MKRVLLTSLTILLISMSTSAQSVSFIEPTGGCAPYMGFLTNTSSGCDAYLWDFGDGNTSTTTAGSFSYTWTYGGWHTVRLKGWAGGIYVGEAVSVVYVEGIPQLEPLTICPDEKFRVDVDVWADTYLWDTDDGGTQTQSYLWHEYPTPGTRTVVLDMTFAGCGNYVDSFPVIVANNAPMDYGYFYGQSDTICPGDQQTFEMNWYLDYFIDYGDGASYSSSSENTFDAGKYHVYSGAGTYYPEVTLINNCGNDTTMRDTLVVTSTYNKDPYPQFWFNNNDTSCVGAPVEVQWNADATSVSFDFGNGTVDTNPAPSVYPVFTSVGEYEIVMDATNGCGNSGQFVDTITIVNSIGFNNLSVAVQDSICVSNTLFVQCYTNDEDNTEYLWNFGDGTIAESRDVSHTFASVGTYNVSLTATNVCGVDSTIVTVVEATNSYGYGSQNFTLAFPSASCVGDTSLIVIVPGGGSTYEVDYGSGFVPETFSELNAQEGWRYDVIKHAFTTPGVHNVSLRSTNGCGVSRIDTLTFDYTGSSSIEASFIYDESKQICIGQPMEFFPVGGKFFTWNFGDGTGIQSSQGMLNSVYHTYTEPGTYTVILTALDACGTFDLDSTSVVIPDTRITVTANAIDATCGNNDGMALASASGGSAPYQFSWTSGDNTIIADSLTSGIYQVNVVDAIGCSSFDIATVSDQEAATIVVNTVLDVSCAGGADGAIDINIIGGNPPFTFEWSNGKTTEDVNNLVAGPYEVFVTDAYGCVATESILVSEPSESSVTFSKKNSDCGASNGFATVFVSGSTGPYTFVWNTGSGSSTITGLSAGIYEVNVIDANGCLLTEDIIIDDIQGPKVYLDSVSELDCGGAGSDVMIAVFGGNPPYNFDWSNGATTPGLVGVGAGDYTLTVTDQNTCQANLQVSISVDPPSNNDICLVTVDTTTHTNQVVWERTDTVGIDYYNIYRESSLSGLYYMVGSVDADSTSFFTDPVADPFIQSWRYKLTAVNDCGIESDMSPIHKTIHLTSNIGVGGVVNLIWDHYEGFGYPTYHIWRYSDVDGWNNIASVSSANTSYTDATPPGGVASLGYMIEIDPPATCTATKANTDFNSSRSNRSQAVGALSGPTNLNNLNDNISHLKVYPNPGNGWLNVELNFIQSEDADLSVHDITGKMVFKKSINGNGIMLEQIDLNDLNSGVYILSINTQNGVVSERIIIEK